MIRPLVDIFSDGNNLNNLPINKDYLIKTALFMGMGSFHNSIHIIYTFKTCQGAFVVIDFTRMLTPIFQIYWKLLPDTYLGIKVPFINKISK